MPKQSETTVPEYAITMGIYASQSHRDFLRRSKTGHKTASLILSFQYVSI